VKFVFAREKDGKVHLRKRHSDVAVLEVKEMFHFRMAVQPTYGGALNRPYSFAKIPSGGIQ
jgi:hypothetical protein